jgi:hypothetical protein
VVHQEIQRGGTLIITAVCGTTVLPENNVPRVCKCFKNVENDDKYKKLKKGVLAEFPLQLKCRCNGEPTHQFRHEATSPTTN